MFSRNSVHILSFYLIYLFTNTFFLEQLSMAASVFVFHVFNISKTHWIIYCFSPVDQCYNKHFIKSFIGDLFKVTDVTTNVGSTFEWFSLKSLSSGGWKSNKGLSLFRALFLCCCSDSWQVNFCCVTILLCFLHVRNRVYTSMFLFIHTS